MLTRRMKKTRELSLLFIIALTSVMLFSSPIISSASQGTGYVIYSVSITGPNASQSFTVKESVSPSSSNPSLSSIVLTLNGSMQNLTISKLVNSSSPFLYPYMIPLNNESLSYNYGNFTLNLHATNTGSSSQSFNGTNYQMSNYAFTFSASSSKAGMPAKSVSGELVTFPSNLVYSASIALNNTTANVKLLSTNLSLDPPSSEALSQSETTIAMSGVGIALVVIAAFFIVRRWNSRSRPSSFSDSKPSYWVD